jgi:hypothetical protein
MADLKIHDKTDIQSLQKQLPSVTDSTIKSFSLRFTQFWLYEETAKFIKCAI